MVPVNETPKPSAHPDVQGRCPACRRSSLFLGAGGYVTCSHVDCPEPDAASTLLERGDVDRACPHCPGAPIIPAGQWAGHAALLHPGEGR